MNHDKLIQKVEEYEALLFGPLKVIGKLPEPVAVPVFELDWREEYGRAADKQYAAHCDLVHRAIRINSRLANIVKSSRMQRAPKQNSTASITIDGRTVIPLGEQNIKYWINIT